MQIVGIWLGGSKPSLDDIPRGGYAHCAAGGQAWAVLSPYPRSRGLRVVDDDGTEQFAVHHIDGDPTNNDLENLRLVPVRSHA